MTKKNYKWIALSCTSLGAFFSVMGGSTLMIALPVIMKDLHADVSIIIWTIMGYMLAMTILVPAIGRIADMFGRKKLYVGGAALFTIASGLCGLSNTGIQLLLFRLIQGVGASLMIANSTAIVTDAFPKNELGKALGINAMLISIAIVFGPILGGLLVNLSWRYIFYINVPIGIFVTIWAALQLKELEILPEKPKFDFIGSITFLFGMLSFLAALSIGSITGWMSMKIIGLLLTSILLITLFVYIEGRVEQPMVDLRLLKTRVLAFAYLSNLLNGIARGAVTFLLVFYFQCVRNMDPAVSGILLAPFAISMMIVSPISGWLSDKYGARGLSSVGLLISAVGLLGLMLISSGTSTMQLMIWMLIMGAGSGMFFSPNTSSIMGNVPPDKRGIAAGIRTMFNNAGTVISISLSMAILSSSMTPAAMQGLFAGTQVGSKGIAISGFISGLSLVFTISFLVTILAAVMSYLRGPQPKWETETNKI